jgi:hypothetical protein
MAEESHLMAALAYSPTGLDYLFFTDWAAVHDAMGLDRTHDTIADDWMLGLTRGHVAATVYGGHRMRDHAAEWGWDTLDLEWEALLVGGGLPRVYVLKFHDDFDFAPVVDRFETRGFTREEHGGVPVYSHELDLSQDWVRTTELAIHNVALLEDERVMVLTSAPGVAPAVLHARGDVGTLIEDAAARAVAQRLAGAATVVLLPRPDGCLSFTPNPLLAAIGKAEIDPEKLLYEQLPVQPQAIYTALGLGYHYPRTGRAGADAVPVDAVNAPYWLVVMHFPSPELAELDLAPRLALAEQGMSQSADMPYSDLYSVEAATVAGSDILLALAPVAERRKSVLLTMFTHRDMPFAACP